LLRKRTFSKKGSANINVGSKLSQNEFKLFLQLISKANLTFRSEVFTETAGEGDPMASK